MIAKYFSQDFPSLLVNYTVCIKELGKNEENLVSQNLCVCVCVHEYALENSWTIFEG